MLQTKSYIKGWSLLLGLSLAAFTSLLIILFLWRDYQLSQHIGEETLRFHANNTAGKTERVLGDMELVLDRLREKILFDSQQNLREELLYLRDSNSLLMHLLYTDSTGKIVGWTGPAGVAPPDITQRTYFTSLRDDPSLQFFLSKPLESLSSPGRFFVNFSLPIRSRDNEFLGIVSATFDYNKLVAMLEELRQALPGLGLSLIYPDGEIMSRAPQTSLSLGRIVREIAQKKGDLPKELEFQNISSIDNQIRISYVIRLEKYPLLAGASLKETEILKFWQSHLVIGLVLGVTFNLIIGFGVYALWREIRRKDKITFDLWEKQRDLVLAQSAVEQGGDMVFWLDRQGRCLSANNAGMEKLGYSIEEIKGVIIGNIIPELNSRLWDPYWQDVSQEKQFHFEANFKDRNGQIFPVEITTNHVSYAGIEYNLIFARDISLRKMAELALVQSENKFRTIFENAGVGIVETNLNGRIITANSAILKMLGYSFEELSEKTWPEITHPEDLGANTALFEAMRQGQNEGYKMEKRYLHKNGDAIWANLTVTLIKDTDKKPLYSLAIIENISERKASEAEVIRSNSDLEQFSYAISHDLQEPLRMITSYLGLIERKLGPLLAEETQEYFAYAKNGAKRMSLMIKDLLEYSRIKRKGQPLEVFDLDQSLDMALLNLSVRMEETHARITCDKLPQIIGDSSQMMRVFQNLIGNALKYQRENVPPLVNISCRTEGEYWLIEITDNGRGIDSKYWGGLFQLFHRIHTNYEEEGSGVGLAICRRIIERHKGEIGIKSSIPGEGSVFYFTLPKVTTV